MQGIPISSASSASAPSHWDTRGLAAMPADEAAPGMAPSTYGIESGYQASQPQYGANSFPYVPNSSSTSIGTSSSYRPRSGDYTSAHRPSYVSEIPPPTSVPLQYSSSGGPAPRQAPLGTSLNSHDDYTAPAPWSQSQAPSLTASRNNSIYSLDGQMGSMAVGPGNGAGVEGHAPISSYGGAPSQPQQHRLLTHTIPNVHADRRFSLDDRRAPSARNGPSGASTPGRTWPWGASPSAAMTSSTGNGAAGAGPTPSSLPSAAPFHSRASYDYGSMGSRSLLPGSNGGNMGPHDSAWQSYDSSNLGSGSRGNPLGLDSNAPARMRAMSSSAGPSRGHPYATAYGGGGGASVLFGRPSSPSGEFDQFSSSGGKFKLLPPSQSPSASVPSTIPPGVGPGGGVTRRTKFKRSRTGCLVCRKRKVKCSQDGTPCRQCRIGKRDCYYQEEPRKGGKGKKKGAEGRRESLVSVDGDEEESEEGSDEEEGEGEGTSFDDSLLPRGSHPEEQLHNFGGAAPIPRYEPLYSGQAHNHSSHDQHQRATGPVYDSGVRGGVEFNMPFDGHSASQHPIHQSPHQHQHQQQQHQQHYHHPHQTAASSIDTSVRSVGSIGSAGGDSSFDTGGSTGPTSIGSASAAAMPGGPISGPVPLHKGEDEGRGGGVAGGGGGGWYDPVAAVLRGEDAQSRYF